MKLTITRNKNNTTYYLCETFRVGKKVSSRTISRIGTEKELKAKFGEDFDAEQYARDFVAKANKAQEENKPLPVTLQFNTNELTNLDEQRIVDVGYLPLQKILYGLGIDKIAKEIKNQYQFKYDLCEIIRNQVYARIISPASKAATHQYNLNFNLEQPSVEYHDIMRSLDVIEENNDFIQSSLYENSVNLCERGKRVLFYDCTNFYFEIEEQDEFRKYGKSKEHRPNPIVQMGMFMDSNGLPLGFALFPGNQNEQLSLEPLEKRIINDYKLENKEFIICTDAGLASQANRKFNSIDNRSFIVTQSIKKLKTEDRDWALNKGRSLTLEPIKADENPNKVKQELEANGWRIVGGSTIYSLKDIEENEDYYYDYIFYKEKYLIDPKTKKEQRFIVTYSIKYKQFLERKRAEEIIRAEKLLSNKKFVNQGVRNSQDITRMITTSHTTASGEEAVNTTAKINEDAINQEAMFDGFYAVCTSIDKEKMPVAEILKLNSGRWEIEESFRILKTNMKARPVYVYNPSRIKAHFIICYIALLVIRILEQKLHLGKYKEESNITIDTLVNTLRNLKLTKIKNHYTSSFTRTKITDRIMDFLGFNISKELILQSEMEQNIKKTKKI